MVANMKLEKAACENPVDVVMLSWFRVVHELHADVPIGTQCATKTRRATILAESLECV